MLTKNFDYHLPQKLIAQTPTKPRDSSRLLILNKKNKKISHNRFHQITKLLNPGDIVVFNNSQVIPARLSGKKITGGEIEMFLLQKIKPRQWEILASKQLYPKQKIVLSPTAHATIIKQISYKSWSARFNVSDKHLFALGETPTPPYIKSPSSLTDYQTVYAKHPGSVAAPTAGLHFTQNLLQQLKNKGVRIAYITLHIGLGTFEPVVTKNIEQHHIHQELATINQSTAKQLNQVKKRGGKIVAVGTTTLRTLEAFSNKNGTIKPQKKWVKIFIYPGYEFKCVDALITNFHLPQSTLIMLVSAFAGKSATMRAYKTAVEQNYRFYSFGDAMIIT